MSNIRIIAISTLFMACCLSLSAQKFKSDRLRQAARVLNLQFSPDSLLPNRTFSVTAKDGRSICMRTDVMGEIEHVGIPLFNDAMRLLEPSPVYDFLEYAVMNWKYRITDNRLYLSKVIFRKGSWEMLCKGKFNGYDCQIENREEKLYIVSWHKDGKDYAELGVPIEYELLNNDTRRNMEKEFVNGLKESQTAKLRTQAAVVSEEALSIYGTEGLFVLPGKSYIADIVNQNIYYLLTTVREMTDTVISKKKVTMSIEAVLPVIVNSQEFPAETFANLMMCDDDGMPDAVIDLDFHLSNYKREHLSIPLSQFKRFCRQKGCDFYFACNGWNQTEVWGILFASNKPKGYNHLLSMSINKRQMTTEKPIVHADVYLYIPPIDKEKLLGTAPTKKSGVKLQLP